MSDPAGGALGHRLDNPVWGALTTRQRPLAEGSERAWRFPAAIAPFAGVADRSRDSLEALAALVSGQDRVALFTREPVDAADGLEAAIRTTARQMVWTAPERPAAGSPFVELGQGDVPEMLELARLCRPGPFGERTRELGTFIGIRVGGTLVAMAGERLKPAGCTEITAVCTHPGHRGRGHAGVLTAALARMIARRGEAPFLHVFSDNAAAIALYRRLGFTDRCEMHVTVFGRPS